jgi:hypothetical protein
VVVVVDAAATAATVATAGSTALPID